MVVQDDGQTKVTAGQDNDGRSPFNGDDADSGDLRARTELQPVEPLEPDKSTFPVGWEGELPPGMYKLVWGAADYGMTTATFTVVEGGWSMLHQNSEADAETLRPNPEVQSYINRTREKVAVRERIPEDEVTLLRVEAIPTSAGTYRIDLGAEGRTFTYHVSEDGITSVPQGTLRNRHPPTAAGTLRDSWCDRPPTDLP